MQPNPEYHHKYLDSIKGKRPNTRKSIDSMLTKVKLEINYEAQEIIDSEDRYEYQKRLQKDIVSLKDLQTKLRSKEEYSASKAIKYLRNRCMITD